MREVRGVREVRGIKKEPKGTKKANRGRREKES